jgi:Ca2+-binding RTX toxin-like protein
MAITTNGLQLVRLAGAVFNQQLSASDYSEILASNKTAVELDAWANAAVAAEFRNKTTTDIAKAVLANVGLSSIAGLEAWVAGQLTAGGGVAKAGATMLSLLNDYSNMSTTEAIYGASVVTFNQKTANAQALSQTAGSATGTYAAVSLTSAPVVFPLTTGADVKTFGSGNDTINALFASATGMTFQATDSLDGGTGTDTINIQVGATGVHAAASMVGIETVSANFSAAGTVSLLGSTGVTTIESSASTAAAAFTNIGSTATALRVTNTGQDANFGFTTAAVAGTTSDAATVTLSAVSGGTVTLAGIELVTLASTGSANTLTALAATSATTVNVSGDQAVNLGTTLSSTVTTLNAGTNTASGAGVTAIMGAAATATITGGTGNDSINISAVLGDVNIVGGAGNDTVTATSGLTTTDTITGGDGVADVLSTTAALAEGYTAPTTKTITGFEQLTLSTAGSASATLTTANVDTGITRVNLAGTGGAYGITGPTAALTVTSTAALNGTLTLTDTGTATSDAATLTNSGVSNANVFAGAAVTSTGYETLTINSGSASTTNAAAQTLGTVTVTVDAGGASAVNFTGANNVSAGAISATTINASGMTGSGTFSNTSASVSSNITGTANNDGLVGSTLADTLSGGVGNDTLTGGTGIDRLTGGSGADTFVFGANTSASVFSNLTASDTITDFVAGTDKLSIGQTMNAYLGNYASLSAAQAAASLDGRTSLGYFVTGDNTLYVVAAPGSSPAATDTTVMFTAGTVTSLSNTDFGIGAQGTGNTVSLTAASANVSNSASTNANTTTSTVDDAISSTAAFMVGSTIDGGAGNDTLTISTAPAALNISSVVSNVERVVLTLGNTGTLTLPSTNAMGVSSSSSTAAISVAMGGGSQTVTAATSGTTTVAMAGASSSVNSSGTGAVTVTAFGSATGQSVTTSSSGIATVTIDGPQTNLTLSLGAAAADLVTITGSATAYGSGVSLTGGTQVGVTDSLIAIAAGGGSVNLNLSAATVTGFETLNLATNAGVFAVTLTPAQNNGFTGLTVTGNDTITMSASGTITGLQTATADDNVLYVLTGTGNVFTAGTVATVTDYGISGGTLSTYNFGSSLTAVDTITGGTGADVLNITGSGVGSANITATETINFTTSTAAQTFTTGAIALPNTGTITAASSTVAVTIDASLLDLTTAGTLIDGPGNDTISVPTDDAERALLTLTLSSGGSDTVIFVDGGNVIGDVGVTINNFTTGVAAAADILDLRTGATTAYNSGPGQFSSLSTAGAVAANSIVEINQALATTTSFATTDAGLAEVAIAAALTTVTANLAVANEGARTSFVILYGAGAQSGNAAIYSVLLRAADLTAGNVATTDIIIELMGIVNGVVADSFVASNFV